MHITTVRPSEMMLDALMRCDLIAVSTREAAKLFTLPGEETKIPEFGTGRLRPRRVGKHRRRLAQ